MVVFPAPLGAEKIYILLFLDSIDKDREASPFTTEIVQLLI
jgi:hypothetical protein